MPIRRPGRRGRPRRESGPITGPDSGGLALVAALLVLAATSALAAGTFLLVSLDLALARNRQELTLAMANAQERLVSVLLSIEEGSASGELPSEAPSMPGVTSYERLSEEAAVLVVAGEAGDARHETLVRIELRPASASWRVHTAERR